MSNWLGSSDAASINVTKIHTVAPDVKIPGSPSRGVRTAEGIALTGSVVASGCASAPRVQGSRVYYAWEQTVPVPASAGGDAPDLVAEASRGWAELCFESRESTWHVPTGIASFCALKTVRKGLSLLWIVSPASHSYPLSILARLYRSPHRKKSIYLPPYSLALGQEYEFRLWASFAPDPISGPMHLHSARLSVLLACERTPRQHILLFMNRRPCFVRCDPTDRAARAANGAARRLRHDGASWSARPNAPPQRLR